MSAFPVRKLTAVAVVSSAATLWLSVAVPGARAQAQEAAATTLPPASSRPPATTEPPDTTEPSATTAPPDTTGPPATTRPGPPTTRATSTTRTAPAPAPTAAGPSVTVAVAGTAVPSPSTAATGQVPARPVPGGPGPPGPPGTDGTGAAGPSPVTDAGQVPSVPGDPTAGAPQSPPPSGGLVAQVRELATSLGRFWHLVPMGLVGLLSWSVWLVRRMLSRLYRPTVNYYRTSTSVVVPVYREDADVLERCLRSWLAEQPDEVVLVVDLEDRHLFERLAGCDHPALRVVAFRHRGKRSALGVGIREARHDVVVLADSDTEWEPGLLAAVQMPFVDPTVGGVGTRQTVYKRESGLWRRVASWLLNTRYLDYVPAMGRAGAVACLSGRTAAYRRSVILPRLPELEHERFLGRECVAGDDGRLTWLVLRSGYRTVYQANARARSMFPDTLGAFVKQRVRWSRNSYRCYLTAACTGWLWRQPFVTQMTVLQILLTPLSMGTSVAAVWFAARQPGTGALALALLWLVAGRGIRGLSHLREHPEDVPLAPLVALVVLLIALPVKAYAFVTMNRQGWLTRHTDLIGGEGQSEASLFQGGASA